MAQIVAQRTTYQATSGQENRLIRNVDERIGMLERQKAPLITFMMQLKKRRAIDSPVHEWLEDDYRARWGQAGGTTISSSATTLAVVDGTIFTPGDVFMVPKAVTSNTAPEVCRVTAVATNTLTITRGFEGSTADTIGSADALRLIGSAYEEGGTLPGQKLRSPVTYTTYLQIFRNVVDYSKTAIASKLYGAPQGERKREHEKKLIEHKEQMNAAFLWGSAYQNLTGGDNGKPIRTTMGLNTRIATNVANANGILTRKNFEAWARQCFRYGSDTKLLLAAPILISAVNQWATEFLYVEPGPTDFGVDVKKVHTGHGTWLLVRDWMLEAPPAGTNSLGGTAFSIDMEEIEYLYLAGNGENRDTKLRLDVLQDGSDRRVDEILTEGGLKVRQEKFHGKMYNITDFAA